MQIFYLCGGPFFPKIITMKEYKAHKFINSALLALIVIPLLIMFPSLKASAAEADPYSVISSFASANGLNILAVSEEPVPGTYTTVTEAASLAKDGDIIYIYPGKYEESLDLRDKDLIFFGQDRDTCIIRFETTKYTSPVLNVSSGTFSNLTLYGYRNTEPDVTAGSASVTAETVDESFSGYVIHIDDDREYGRNLVFKNCNIISENSNCIGLGFRNHFSVSFENCLLRSTGSAGILYVHDPETLIGADSDMNLAFTDCIWQSFGYPYVICAKSIHTTNRVNLTFRNVTTYCYATNKNDLYSPGNAFSGYDVRLQIQLPQVFCNTPIILRAEKKLTYALADLRNRTAYIKPGIFFITYTGEKSPDAAPITVTPYYINNAYDLPGDGWAGSNAFYLTGESSGNTLDEMNYHINN